MDDGKQLLMYTSVVAEKAAQWGDAGQIHQSIAIGDGLDYEKPACNLVLISRKICWKACASLISVDPKIRREVDGTHLPPSPSAWPRTAAQQHCSRARDGFDLNFVTVLERCNNQYGKMECPDFFPLDGKAGLDAAFDGDAAAKSSTTVTT